MAQKKLSRAKDEAVKPLERYRAEELSHMKENFFGGDVSYHIARFHFVHKISCHMQPAKEAREKYAPETKANLKMVPRITLGLLCSKAE